MIIKYDDINETIQRGIFNTNGSRCCVCGTDMQFSNDCWELMVPNKLGGVIERNNIMPVCPNCHKERKGIELPSSRYIHGTFNKKYNTFYLRKLMQLNLINHVKVNPLVFRRFECYTYGNPKVHIGNIDETYHKCVIIFEHMGNGLYNIMYRGSLNNRITTKRTDSVLSIKFEDLPSKQILSALCRLLYYAYPVMCKNGITKINIHNIYLNFSKDDKRNITLREYNYKHNSAEFDTKRAMTNLEVG